MISRWFFIHNRDMTKASEFYSGLLYGQAAFLFDVDHTLVISDGYWYKAMLEVLKDLRLPAELRREVLELWLRTEPGSGRGIASILPEIESAFSRGGYPTLWSYQVLHLHNLKWTSLGRPLPGVREVLSQARRLGVGCFGVTSNHTEIARSWLASAGLDLQVIAGRELLVRGLRDKPATDFWRHAIDQAMLSGFGYTKFVCWENSASNAIGLRNSDILTVCIPDALSKARGVLYPSSDGLLKVVASLGEILPLENFLQGWAAEG